MYIPSIIVSYNFYLNTGHNVWQHIVYDSMFDLIIVIKCLAIKEDSHLELFSSDQGKCQWLDIHLSQMYL